MQPFIKRQRHCRHVHSGLTECVTSNDVTASLEAAYEMVTEDRKDGTYGFHC